MLTAVLCVVFKRLLDGGYLFDLVNRTRGVLQVLQNLFVNKNGQIHAFVIDERINQLVRINSNVKSIY